jgi:FkbM family methyltransferase
MLKNSGWSDMRRAPDSSAPATEQQLRQALLRADSHCCDGPARLAHTPILIYGAGNYGRIIYRLLTGNGIPAEAIAGFLDAAAEGSSLLGRPVLRPDDPEVTTALRREAEVVISIYLGLAEQSSIAARLNDLGYRKVRSGYETAISFHIANDAGSRIAASSFWHDNLESIMAGCGLWEDQRSIDTYLNHFIGYASCDIGRFLLETDHSQYFAAPPLTGKGRRRFIDCGAFDGDTVRSLLSHCGKAESLALFEPCGRNFSLLRDFVRNNEGRLADRLLLFPCGVWDRSAQLRFDSDAAAASSVTEQGDGVIQCVALDDALHGFDPTCIKMDIEGAEPYALRGAQAMIRQHKPDLAISVYHSLSHFWEIPALVRQWVPEYRFFLRTYAAAGFETVMYAVARD